MTSVLACDATMARAPQLDLLSGSETPSVGSDTTRWPSYPYFNLTFTQHAQKNGAAIL